ncbi:MAG: hypothetical protein D3904_05320 [Candidatus Electrothrix sp. EH2]|nr:hypothetical protein [Candidatus Electrothrix sp. EH2]
MPEQPDRYAVRPQDRYWTLQKKTPILHKKAFVIRLRAELSRRKKRTDFFGIIIFAPLCHRPQ